MDRHLCIIIIIYIFDMHLWITHTIYILRVAMFSLTQTTNIKKIVLLFTPYICSCGVRTFLVMPNQSNKSMETAHNNLQMIYHDKNIASFSNDFMSM